MDIFGTDKKLGFGCMRLPMQGEDVYKRQT